MTNHNSETGVYNVCVEFWSNEVINADSCHQKIIFFSI